MVCYDLCDRASFQRAAHILMSFVVDRHLSDSKHDSVVCGRDAPCRLATMLCGTKADEDEAFAVSSEEVQEFVRTNNVDGSACTSAKMGDGVCNAFYDLAAAVLEAERESNVLSAKAAAGIPPIVDEAWSLTCPNRIGHCGTMTSPRGARPFEPLRAPPLASAAPLTLRSSQGQTRALQERVLLPDVERLVEAFDQHGNATGTRTLGRCLERGLRHRAVHIWLVVPRTGALLLRRYAPDAPKHPGRWGPTVHGEILCYGSDGDGHAAEVSTQAAARSIREQLGFDASEVDELEHWFSCTSEDGKCVEIVDVYVAALKGQGLPPLQLLPAEEVDWAFFGDVFSDEAKRAGSVFKAEEDYIMAMLRPLRARVVKNDVMNAFGPEALASLEHDKIRGLAAAGGEVRVARGISARQRLPGGGQRVC